MNLFSVFNTKKAGVPPLSFHNTLTNKVEEFSPLSTRAVRMYNCGPTPYDTQHIGNMVPPILGNIIRRSLEVWGYKVDQVMNVTDFGHLTGDNDGNPDVGDDKMTKGLKRDGLEPTMENMSALAEKYAAIFFDDVAKLGIDNTKVRYPRASAYIPEQIALIATLEQKGYAYVIDDGVYFDTSRFKEYGKLGNINLEGQRDGARVEGSSEKKHAHDFVLWKKSDTMGWESPWGLGFPGWHIECTAMIFTLLGKQIDIHTGGIEHIPIHHNNEIAQAEAATGKKFVKYWLHNAHITVEGKKISKSLGNTVYLHSITDRGFSPLAFRYWYLTGHYRTPMNFTWDAIEGANTALMRLYRFYFEELPKLITHAAAEPTPDAKKDAPKEPHDGNFLQNFYAAIANDLDTPKAIALMWGLIKDQDIAPSVKKSCLLEADAILGLGLSEKRSFARMAVVERAELHPDIQDLVDKREEARKNKDFAGADDLRKQIEDGGYDLKDTPEGPEITRKA